MVNWFASERSRKKKAAFEIADRPPERKKKPPFVAKLLESNSLSRGIVYKKAEELVRKQTWGNYPAPLKIIACVKAGLEKGVEGGMEAEIKNFGELMMSPQSVTLPF